jgi:hypothetical protein
LRGAAQRLLYSLDAEPLAELDDWLSRYRRFWTNRLNALDTEIRPRRGKQWPR